MNYIKRQLKISDMFTKKTIEICVKIKLLSVS